MVWIRILAAAAGLGVAGAALARRAARRAVDERKDSLLAWAEQEARQRIRTGGDAFLSQVLRRFVLSTFVKIALLAGLFALLAADLIQAGVFSLMVSGLLIVFVIRDLAVSWPTLRLAASALARNAWRPRQALGSVVAAEALTAALETARGVELGWRERVALAIAGVDQDTLSHEIATRTAEIARAAAWPELRPYARATALKMLGGTALYSAFIAALLAAA